MCIIDHELKLIYIAIPKSASTSIQTLMKTFKTDNSIVTVNGQKNDMGLHKHSTALEIKKCIKEYDSYHKFAVIRNPYDWYVSWYTYRKREKSGYDTNNITFKEYLEKQPMKEILDWITDENGNIIVDTIIRYENNIENEVYKLFDKLNISYKKKLQHKNISTKREDKNYKSYYSNDEEKMVQKYQEKTLKHFEYQY